MEKRKGLKQRVKKRELVEHYDNLNTENCLNKGYDLIIS